MIQVYPDDGLVEILRAWARRGFNYHLFVNDGTPDFGWNIAESITEASYTGYAPQPVAEDQFTSGGVVDHQGVFIGVPIGISNTSGEPQQAYGYYVTFSDDDTHLIFAARFDDAPVTVEDGHSFIIPLQLGDQDFETL